MKSFVHAKSQLQILRFYLEKNNKERQALRNFRWSLLEVSIHLTITKNIQKIMSEKCCCCCSARVPSLVKKYLMAATGLVLVLFLLGHVVGNLQMFQAPEKINTYAHMLHALPPAALWGFRVFMFVCIVVHFGLAIKLKLENLAARGNEPYSAKATRYAAWSARAMILSGIVIIAFVVWHLLQFTVFKETGCLAAYENATEITVVGGHGFFGYMGQHGNDAVVMKYQVFDVFQMVYNAFANPLISLGYIVAMLLLLSHLSHGAHSMFQSVGLRNEKLRPIFRAIALLYALFVCFGLIAVPAGVLSGVIKPNPDTTAPVEKVQCPLEACCSSTCDGVPAQPETK